VNDTLKQIHNKKVNIVNSITKDYKIDNMYENMNDDMKHVNKFMKIYINTTKAYK
jgi:hypothetical protein